MKYDDTLFDEYFEISGSYTIKPAGIDVDGNCKLREQSESIKKLPVKFHTVTGSLILSGRSDLGEGGLTSLDGCPEMVGNNFRCDYNLLTSLEGGPKQVVYDYAANNNQLSNLLGAPERVGGYFDCSSNTNLTSLLGAPIYIGGEIRLGYKSNLPMLPLVKYNDVFMYGHASSKIVMKYCEMHDVPLRKRILLCQKELIDSGFAGNATL